MISNASFSDLIFGQIANYMHKQVLEQIKLILIKLRSKLLIITKSCTVVVYCTIESHAAKVSIFLLLSISLSTHCFLDHFLSHFV